MKLRKSKMVGVVALSVVASVAFAADDSGVQKEKKGKFPVHVGFQTAKYSLDDSDMTTAGAYLGVEYIGNDWLSYEASVGYSIGDSYDLDSALVSDMETVNLNIVLKPRYQIDNFSVYGKLGLNYSVLYYSVGWGYWSTSAIGAVVGGGVSYEFGALGVQAECLLYPGNDVDYEENNGSGGTLEYSPEIRLGLFYAF